MSFATPAILFALAALPAIWWLLRLTPPRARAEIFPPARILADLANREETPAHTPWWLILLRLLLAALLILALSGPAIAPAQDDAPGDGPLLIVLDNGWDAARDWEARRDAALAILDQAGEDERPVAMVATAEGPDQILSPTSAEEVADRIRALEPHPFAPDYDALLPQIETLITASGFGAAAWFSGGLAHDGADDLATALGAIDGAVTLYRSADETVLALRPPENGPEAMTVTVIRSDRTATDAAGQVLARDLRGRAIAEADFAFAGGETSAVATFDLPQELRNEIVRLEIAGEQTAGAVQLLDERYRRRTIGILTGEAEDQPLLSAEYYLSRAVTPFADPLPTSLELGQSVNDLVGSGASIIILADIGTLPDDAVATLTAWIEAGGTLIRFAGPRFAAADPLLTPVLLRTGGRVIGGTLSWEEPQPLGPFPEASPFFGLAVPGDVTVSQQVLAEPTVALAERTWATLADGTPLVTATDRGEGRIVLFHVTADPDWSNLPLSGVFVEMLQRIAILAEAPDTAEGGAEAGTLPPWRVLDGNGRLIEPGDAIEPLPGGNEIAPGATNPPGLYGTEEAFRAFNLIGPDTELRSIDDLAADGLVLADLPGEDRIDLAPWLFAAAFLLFLLDTGAVMLLGGDRAATRRASASAAAIIMLALIAAPLHPRDAAAQDLTEAEQFALQATSQTTLAYVVTGDPENDEISRAGMTGLSEILRQRTAFEPGQPIGLDLEADELAFFPIIFWRVSPDAPMPTPAAMQRLGAYMRAGGIVLFDTADQLQRNAAGAVTATTEAGLRLQEMLAGLDIPPLEPVPPDHVLTQTYYLLSDLPGRYDGGDFWVEVLPDPPADGEPRPARPTDDVSPILITSNDFAAAWAINDNGAFMFPLVASNPRQREMAFRAGINIVMYALTGNYKTDQVHIPDLLDRMAR